MMTPAQRRAVRIFAALALLGVIALYLSLANPSNWGVRKSEHFSKAKFEAIRNGEPIADVVARLGRSVSIGDPTSFPAVCPRPDCTVYAFTGDPAPWVIGHAEYWVIADHRHAVIADRRRVRLSAHPRVLHRHADLHDQREGGRRDRRRRRHRL